MMDDPDRLRPRDPRFARTRDRRSWSRRPARRSSSPSAKPTWGSTATAPTCSGSTWTRSGPTIRRSEYYLTDMAEILNRAGHYVEAMQIDDAREALGINTRLELAEVDRLFRERKVRELMLGGRDHREAGDGDDRRGVRIGMDTIVEAVRADSRPHRDRRELPDRELLDHSRTPSSATKWRSAPFTIVGTSRLERGAHAGPFARLRMENHVEAGRAHRQLRGVEEDPPGRGREGQPPGVSRRLRRSAPT